MIQIDNIAVDLCGNDFLLPYLEIELEKEHSMDDTISPVGGVRICTDESEGAYDKSLDEYCDKRHIPLAVIRCPYIVGTGMKGLMMKIASGINRGKFVHIAGNEARISVVHAVDVARAVGIACGAQGSYTLTDGCDPRMSELADAFAYRLNDKRIITIKPRWARLWYGSAYFRVLSSDHVAASTFGEVFPEMHPVSVIEYLTTHVYDDKSL